jgi:hypothetical protein
MPDYRLYCLDELGKIAQAEWIEAGSDDEAIVIARAKQLAVDCEIWEGNRLIANVPAQLE